MHFVKRFYMSVEVHLVVFVVYSTDMVYYAFFVCDFFRYKSILNSWDKSYLVMVDNLFYMFASVVLRVFVSLFIRDTGL